MKYLFLISAIAFIFSCTPYHQRMREDAETPEVKVTKSATIPDDGGSPIAGFTENKNADRTITFSALGEKYPVKNGEEVNIIYDGIDPEGTYVAYEPTFEGYNLELKRVTDPVDITFKKLCDIYIVASPTYTSIAFPRTLKFEQIVWTPRTDGTWEVRIGTTERGCKSQALKDLQNMRNKDYDKSVPK